MKNKKPFSRSGSKKTGDALPEKPADGFSVPVEYFSELPGHIRKLTLQEKEDSGFAVPEKYFEQLPGRMARLLLHDRDNKANTFRVPASYFDKLPLQIAERIHGGKKSSSRETKRVLVPVALALLALLLTTLVFFLNIDPVAPVQTAEVVNNISVDDALEYLNESITEVNEDDLVEAAIATSANTALPDAGTDVIKTPELFPEANEIEEYLLEQNIDETTLLTHDL